MRFKLLTEHHLKGGCTGSSESTLVKMPRCWKSHVGAHLFHIAAGGAGVIHFSSSLKREFDIAKIVRTALKTF